jgi:protein tyrosine phosphatase (PTP) superfamily phosphohydrolase (DUF442 family)
MFHSDRSTKIGGHTAVSDVQRAAPGKTTRVEAELGGQGDGASPATASGTGVPRIELHGPQLVAQAAAAIAQQTGNPRSPGAAALEQHITSSPAPEVSRAAQAMGGAKALASSIEERAKELGGWLVGKAELHGFRYGVKHYIARVDSGLFRGSRFETPQDVEAAVAQGVRSTVNLCLEDSGGDAGNHYGIDVTKYGLVTHHVPILDNTAPTFEQMDEFVAFARANPPCYVHCEAGQGRTGVAVSCYRIAVDQFTAEQAIAEAMTFGMSLKNQQAFVRAYAERIAQRRRG